MDGPQGDHLDLVFLNLAAVRQRQPMFPRLHHFPLRCLFIAPTLSLTPSLTLDQELGLGVCIKQVPTHACNDPRAERDPHRDGDCVNEKLEEN